MKPAAEWLGQFAVLWEAPVDRGADDLAERKTKEKKRPRRK
jgi:hypothetical protein